MRRRRGLAAGPGLELAVDPQDLFNSWERRFPRPALEHLKTAEEHKKTAEEFRKYPHRRYDGR